MKYTVRSGSKKHKFEIPREADFSQDVPLEVGKKNVTFRVHEKGPTGEIRTIAVNNRILSVQVRRRPDGFPYKVIINGTAHPVEVERVESTRYKPPVPEKKVNGVVKAYLPGQIIKILVDEGESVRQGQPLLTLEAMKMENEIVAPRDGVVRGLAVKIGQLVPKGTLLLEVE